MKTRNLAEPCDFAPIDWSGVKATLDAGFAQAPGSGGPDRHTCWLVALDPDGRPHVSGVGALWVYGASWFETGERTRKARNLARDSRCSLAVALAGYDLVVEGDAVRVADRTTVATMAERWRSGGWPCEVEKSGSTLRAAFSAPSAGPSPWFVYRLSLQAATAVATREPGGATRWRF